MYRQLSQGATVAHAKDIWKSKVPLKFTILKIAVRNGPSRMHVPYVVRLKMRFTSSLLAPWRSWCGVCYGKCMGAIGAPRMSLNFMP
jgi:hypothetical protein